MTGYGHVLYDLGSRWARAASFPRRLAGGSCGDLWRLKLFVERQVVIVRRILPTRGRHRDMNMRELFGRCEGVVVDIFFEADAQDNDYLLIIVHLIDDPQRPASQIR